MVAMQQAASKLRQTLLDAGNRTRLQPTGQADKTSNPVHSPRFQLSIGRASSSQQCTTRQASPGPAHLDAAEADSEPSTAQENSSQISLRKQDLDPLVTKFTWSDGEDELEMNLGGYLAEILSDISGIDEDPPQN